MATTDNKQSYEVTLAGLPLKLKSSHDDETVQELADLVNQKIDDVLSSNSSVSFQNALILASLHIAEDYILLKRSALQELDKIEKRTEKVLSHFEDSPISQIRLDG